MSAETPILQQETNTLKELPKELEPLKGRINHESLKVLDDLNFEYNSLLESPDVDKYHDRVEVVTKTMYEDDKKRNDMIVELTEEYRLNLAFKKIGIEPDEFIDRTLLTEEDRQSDDFKDRHNAMYDSILIAAGLDTDEWLGQEVNGANPKLGGVHGALVEQTHLNEKTRNDRTQEAIGLINNVGEKLKGYKDVNDLIDQKKPELVGPAEQEAIDLINSVGEKLKPSQKPEVASSGLPISEAVLKLKEKINLKEKVSPTYWFAKYQAYKASRSEGLIDVTETEKTKYAKFAMGALAVVGAGALVYAAVKWGIEGSDGASAADISTGNEGSANAAEAPSGSGSETIDYGDSAYQIHSGEGLYETMDQMKGLDDLTDSQKEALLKDVGPKLADMKLAYKMGDSWGLNLNEGKMPQKALDLIRSAAVKRGFIE